MLSQAPLATSAFVPEVIFVPEKPKKSQKIENMPSNSASEKSADRNVSDRNKIAIETTGDAKMDAKLASMDPAKAQKVRVAFMAKRAKIQSN